MERFIIVSLKHSTKDKVMFWRANDAGYTYYPFAAGIYTKEQVEGNKNYYDNGFSTIAVPLTEESLQFIGLSIKIDYDKLEQLHKKRNTIS